MATAPLPSSASAPDWHDYRVPLIHGLADKRIDTGEDFETRTLGSFWTLLPGDRPKHHGLAFIPSTHYGHDARDHAVQRAQGMFVALVGDVDKGNHSLQEIENLVRGTAGATAYLIHSTAHALAGDMRWRIILPLAEPVPFEEWRDAQEALFDLARSSGIEMDGVTQRAAQISFLPNVPTWHAETGQPLRGENGPLYYLSKSSDVVAPGLSLDVGPILQAIAALRRRRAEDDRLRENLRREAERRRATLPQSDDGSVIDAFNRSNALADLLTQYGYTPSRGDSRDWRSPQQTSGSFATRLMGDKWVSLSGSDEASGLGQRCASGCFGDAYDLYVHYEHGGDRNAAWKAVCEEQGRQPSRRQRFAQGGPWREPGDPGHEEMPQGAGAAANDSASGEEPPEADVFGVQLTDFHAYMPAHNYIFAPSGEFWPATSVNSRIPPVPLFDRDGNPVMSEKKGKEDEQVRLPANAWLDQNRAVEQMTWAPGEPQVVNGRLISDGGWMPRPGCRVFNLYRPPLPQKGDASKAAPWLDHVHKVYPDDADHIIGWLAHRVQRPAEKINHALVMGGSQGVGKDTILEPVKAAIGPWNFSEVSPQHMLGRFNGFLKSVILRVSEARDLGDVDRFAFYDHMKTYTAAPPDVLRIDEKHRNEYSIFNVCGVIITTNHKTDGIYLPTDDRRHYVAWSELSRDEFSPDYWTGLYDWYQAGGIGHVVAYLQSLSLGGFDAKAPPPKTPAFWDIVSANQAPEEAELSDALEALGWPNAVTVAAAADYASEAFRDFLLDRRNSRRIPHRFEECGYVQVRNDGARDGLFKVRSRRCVIYAKKTLPRRDQIAAAENLISR